MRRWDRGERGGALRHAESTPAIATALNPYIGYDKATEIVKEAVASKRTIREVAREKGVDDETLDKALDLTAMARGSKASEKNFRPAENAGRPALRRTRRSLRRDVGRGLARPAR